MLPQVGSRSAAVVLVSSSMCAGVQRRVGARLLRLLQRILILVATRPRSTRFFLFVESGGSYQSGGRRSGGGRLL